MIDLILAILAVIPPALWVLYRIIMRLKERRDALKLEGKGLPVWTLCWGMPTLFIGYLLDFVTNVLHSTVLFMEFPKELTVSARVKRHTNDTSVPSWYWRWLVEYRRFVARLMRDKLLKPYDPSGGHD
jgi:hypothetical protein